MRYFKTIESGNSRKALGIYIFTVVVLVAGFVYEVTPIVFNSNKVTIPTTGLTKAEFLNKQRKGATIILGFTQQVSQEKRIYKIEKEIGFDSLYISTSKRLFFAPRGQKYLLQVIKGEITLEDTITLSRNEFIEFVHTADSFTGLQEFAGGSSMSEGLVYEWPYYLRGYAQFAKGEVLKMLLFFMLFYVLLILIYRWLGKNQSSLIFILLIIGYAFKTQFDFDNNVKDLLATPIGDKVSIYNFHETILTQHWFFLAIFIAVSILYKFFVKDKLDRIKFRYLFTFLYFYCALMIGFLVLQVLINIFYISNFDAGPIQNRRAFIYAFTISTLITLGQFLYTKLGKKNSDKITVLKQQVLQTKSELAALQSSVNPHFLYNSLNSIATLAKKDPQRTEDMSLALSQFYKYITNRESKTIATVKEELNMLGHYLAVEKIRFEDRLMTNIQYNDEALDISIPYFLLQPLVENAIKYGYNKDTNTITIGLDIQSQINKLQIKVSDSGPLFRDDMSRGYGLKSVMKKLELMYPNQHTIEFVNEPKHVLIIISKHV